MLKPKKITLPHVTAFLICFSLTSYAEDLQKFSVRNNDTVVAIISERELSRFVFEEGKIKQIFAISGDLHYEVVDENLYIKPNVQKLVNFFVSTEKGNTYKIIATPKDIPATQIYIMRLQKDSDELLNKHKMTGESIFRKKISKIIKAIKADDRTVGYKVRDIGASYKDKNGLKVYFESKWQGGGVIGEKHLITNNSNQAIKLDKSCYLDKQTDAVYIDQDIIEPGTSAVLIKARVR